MRVPETREELQAILKESIEKGEIDSIAPVVVVNQNLNPAEFIGFWCGDAYVRNDEVSSKLESGWHIIRIQTEFQGLDLGFHTMVYMVETAP